MGNGRRVLGSLVAVLVVLGVVAWFFQPLPPVIRDRRALAKIESTLREEIGPDYSLEVAADPFRYHPPGFFGFYPSGGSWTRHVTVTARSVLEPEFAVSSVFYFQASGQGLPLWYGPTDDELASDATWAHTLRGMSDARRQSFMRWWVEHPTSELCPPGTRVLQNLYPGGDYGGILPPTVLIGDVYNIWYANGSGQGSIYIGWDSVAHDWVELDW